MAPLPKRRHSTRRSGKRKKSLEYIKARLVACKNCGSLTLAHHICRGCGYYKGHAAIVKREKT